MIDIENLTLKEIREIAAIAGGSCGTRPARTKPPFRERLVIARTSGGVQYGLLVARDGTWGRIDRCRHIRTWQSIHGKLAINCADLAVVGAGSGTSITRPVDGAEFPTIYGTFDVTPEAAKALDALPIKA
jgi:hypothetical protein